jgi:hypothetical protein
VDTFVSLLLYFLKYFSGALFPVQKLPLPLCFGQVAKTAAADFTVLDIFSFYRMAIIEDKNLTNLRAKSEPQLVAEAIAIHQKNSAVRQQQGKRLKVEEDESGSSTEPIFGVRINGYMFHFYCLYISDSIENAMRTSSQATKSTKMFRLGSEDGYNFVNQADRDIIISVLDNMRTVVAFTGTNSERKPSR